MTSTGYACGDVDYCSLLEIGYPYCRPCEEHHRAPECPIDEQGRALAPCGCTWEATEQARHYDTVHRGNSTPPGVVGAAHTPTPPVVSTPVDPVNEGNA